MSIAGGPDIVENGLVLHLDAADSNSYPGSGTVWTDLSGNGNNGTLTNGPTYSSANKGSIVFDGTNDYVSTNYTSSLGNNLSFGAWAYPTSAGQFAGSDIISKGYSSSTPFASWGIDFQSNNTFRFFVSDNTIFNPVVSSVQSLNKWYYIFATYTNKILNAYINGILAATITNTNDPLDNSSPVYIGVWYNDLVSNNFFTGRIAQTQVYNRALSASEVLQNYNATKGRYGL